MNKINTKRYYQPVRGNVQVSVNGQSALNFLNNVQKLYRNINIINKNSTQLHYKFK